MDNGGKSSHSEGDFVAIYFPLTRPLICTHEAVIPLTFKVRSQNTGRFRQIFRVNMSRFSLGMKWCFFYNFISM